MVGRKVRLNQGTQTQSSTKYGGYAVTKVLQAISRTNTQQIATEHLLLTVETPKVPPNSKLWPRTGPKSQP